MAVCSEDFTDLFRCLRRSLVRMRFFCDLMLVRVITFTKLVVVRRDADDPLPSRRPAKIPGMRPESQSGATQPAKNSGYVGRCGVTTQPGG